MQIFICHGALKLIDASDNYIQFILNFKQYKNGNFTNFVYYGKTRMRGTQNIKQPYKLGTLTRYVLLGQAKRVL